MRTRTVPIAFVQAALLTSTVALGVDCTGTSVGVVPLNDLGPGLYLGQFQGGLYPGGRNTMALGHLNEGLIRAAAIIPRAASGAPDAAGAIVLMSVGMSNATNEWCSPVGGTCSAWSFAGQAAASAEVEHANLRIIDGASGGQTSQTWDSPTDANYDRVRDMVLAPRGLTEAQVQAIWLKTANAGPSVALPNANADAFALKTQIGNIVRACRTRYPNLQIILLSSRIYAGYADTALNPEPYAYEGALGVKWAIQAQITQAQGGGIDPAAGDLAYATTPWLGWAAYLWADGLTARSDGLTWACSDFSNDGTHPAVSGRTKVGNLLMDHMLNSPFAAPWFRADGARPCPADFNFDRHVTVQDIFDFLAGYFGSLYPAADFNLSGGVSVQDLFSFLAAWFAGPCP